jgi:orotate phosphoribosyltransferase
MVSSSQQPGIELLEEAGAILKGHFRLSSGRHSDTYFEKFRLLERPDLLTPLCQRIADAFSGKVNVVAGPTTGGILVAFEVARLLGVPAIYIEREAGKRVLRRGAQLPSRARVLVVDDILTTGTSLFEVLPLMREEAEVVGIGVLVDRSEQKIDFGCPLFAAITAQATSYAEGEVPEWLNSIPISEPGSRNLA